MINHTINNSFTTIYTSSTNRNAPYNQYKCVAVYSMYTKRTEVFQQHKIQLY